MSVNPFRQDGDWHKANLHTHTTASDGHATAEQRVQQYRAKGYSVLAITDHGVSSDTSGFSVDDFVLLDGIEVTACPYEGPRGFHLVCLNIPSDATVPATSDPNDVIAWAKQEGGEALIAHPYWSGNTAEELLSVQGHIGIEVYNASCAFIGKAYSSVHWDNMLDRGVRLPALAVDDAHASGDDGADVFRGWTMLKLRELTVPAILDALRTACYYSSSGPEILDFGLDDGLVHVECSDAAAIHFMAANRHGTSLYADDGPPLTHAEAPVGDSWTYVRAEIVGTDGTRAWANPLYL